MGADGTKDARGRGRTIVLAVLVTTVVVAALIVMGDAPSLDGPAVDREADSVSSLVAEGALLADEATHGRGTERSTRVHALELAGALGSSESRLQEARIPHSRRGKAAAAATASGDAAGELEALSTHAGDRETARRANHALEGIGGDLDDAVGGGS